MSVLRVGTRGSDLALWQARTIADTLRSRAGVTAEIVVIETQGDREADTPMMPGVWATGAFVSEIERALAAGQVDLAVHSHKDLASVSLPGLVVAATPPRAPVHDVLIAGSAAVAERLRAALRGEGSAAGLTVGTSSPRRVAQLRRVLGCATGPIRGNVPTRIAKASNGDFDAVCLAAAGVGRLGLAPDHLVDLPIDRFPTAPAQGAIAVQVREGTPAADAAAKLDDGPTHRCVRAERAFLAGVNAGCHAPIAASATIGSDGAVHLHVQLYNDDGSVFEERVEGDDPRSLGRASAERALQWLHE